MTREGRSARSILASSAAAVVLAVSLGGCELLLAGMYGDDFDGSFPSSSPIASYSTGRATIRIAGGETIVLDRLAAGAAIDSFYGSDVRWSSAGGWSVGLSGVGLSGAGNGGAGYLGSGGGYLVFDQIADGHHWSSFEGDRCIVDVEVADAAVLRGSATCKGVEWYDALDPPYSVTAPKPIDAPKFDAEVTFEAKR